MEELLEETIKAGLKVGALNKTSINKLNAILSGCGYNMRKLLSVHLYCVFFYRQRLSLTNKSG
jgi:hypothetical protein